MLHKMQTKDIVSLKYNYWWFRFCVHRGSEGLFTLCACIICVSAYVFCIWAPVALWAVKQGPCV